MNQHDHEHMSDQQPRGAGDPQNKDRIAADHESTHDQHTQPAPADRQAPATSDGAGHRDHAVAEEPAARQPATAPADGGQTEPRDGQSNHEVTGHGGMDHMGMSTTIPLAYRPTRAQIAAVSFLSVLALTAALIFSASYANLRRYLNNGTLPPKDAVRIEEMVNYFDYQYNSPAGQHPFEVSTEVAQTFSRSPANATRQQAC